MSARIQGFSIIMVSAVAAACSQPGTESAATPGQVATAEPVTTREPLVSALEAGARAELTLVRPAEKKPSQPVVAKAPAWNPGDATIEAHNHTVDIGEVTPTVTAASLAPSAEAPTAPAMAPVPAGPALGSGDGQGLGAGGRDPVLFPDRGPGTIIIRGGMGGVYDDCKNHPQGYPAGGIAINHRMPPPGGPGVMASNPSRRPFTPGPMGGTGGLGVPRRGIR